MIDWLRREAQGHVVVVGGVTRGVEPNPHDATEIAEAFELRFGEHVSPASITSAIHRYDIHPYRRGTYRRDKTRRRARATERAEAEGRARDVALRLADELEGMGREMERMGREAREAAAAARAALAEVGTPRTGDEDADPGEVAGREPERVDGHRGGDGVDDGDL